MTLRRAGFELACPLCFLPFRRSDKFWQHLRQTDEEHHRELLQKWLPSACSKCAQKDLDNFLRHMFESHTSDYQNLMRETMRLRSEATGKIPRSPGCFCPEFFFQYRREIDIIEVLAKPNRSMASTGEGKIDINVTNSSYMTRDLNPNLAPRLFSSPVEYVTTPHDNFYQLYGNPFPAAYPQNTPSAGTTISHQGWFDFQPRKGGQGGEIAGGSNCPSK
jgi:hypothetical protein